MKKTTLRILLSGLMLLLLSKAEAQSVQDDFIDIQIDTLITQVQPMTGIVFWQGDFTEVGAEAISMEFSYMLYNDVVDENGAYNWEVVDTKLADIASRKHQAIFRFRYVYPGYETAVPDYIKAKEDYKETEGISEGKTTWFPDWRFAELQRFTLEFYTKFAERYDNDPRLAFIQVGFGLWAEYHIYDGPFELGVTFPSKAFQEDFFRHLDTTFLLTPFSCSIDAADDTYSPFKEKPELLNLHFGNFDDSFMHDGFGEPGEYNTEGWNFFGRERFNKSPAGGEFSYYSDYDQEHVLDWPDGPYGKPWEFFAKDFHMTYIIGNDQPNYQTTARIKQASMASGYQFKIVSFKSKPDSSVVVVKNVGVAPIYYDAFVSVNGVRSPKSLKLMAPGESLECALAAGGDKPLLSIESDRLVPGQSIGYLGTENFSATDEQPAQRDAFKVFPSVLRQGENINIQKQTPGPDPAKLELFSLNGKLVYQVDSLQNTLSISTGSFRTGIYFVRISGKGFSTQTQKIMIR